MPSLDSFGAFLSLLLGFGVVIFVHEMGHFMAAKWFGIKVTQFAIGFGHAVASYRKGIGFRLGSTQAAFDARVRTYLASQAPAKAERDDEESETPIANDVMQIDGAAEAMGLGETEYRLNWMPLGGYVKMLGQEDLNPNANADDPRSFNSKSILARACVISAGVIMNIIFGVVFFIICFSHGVDFPPPIVGGVIPDKPAALAYADGYEGQEQFKGIRAGDRILSVDGEPIDDFMDFAVRVALAKKDQELTVTVARDGQELTYQIKPTVDVDGTRLLSVGIARPISLQVAKEKKWVPKWLTAAGVRPGMTVTAVDGTPITQHHQFRQFMRDSGGRRLATTFQDLKSDETVEVDVLPSPRLQQTDDNVPHLFGLVPATVIGSVIPGRPAHRVGLETGDVFVHVDGKPWPVFNDLSRLIGNTNRRAFEVEVLRDGEIKRFDTVKANRKDLIGIGLDIAWTLPRISQCIEGSPAGPLELPSGSRILSIEGKPVANFADMQRVATEIVATMPEGGNLAISYELAIKGAPQYTKQIAVSKTDVEQILAATWGIPDGMGFIDLRQPVKASTAVEAATMGIVKTRQFLIQTYITLHRLTIERTIQIPHLRGPIGIMDEGTKVAQQGWPYLLFFLGLISVNLAVINFLPIPIVDGGLMFFLLVEKLKGSPVSARVQTAAFFVGLVLIGSIFLLTLYYDAGRLLGAEM